MPMKQLSTPTRLAAFIEANELKPAALAREADCSRQHLLRLRKGIAEPTRPLMVSLMAACRRLLKRRVRMSELFVLGVSSRHE
jgi:hypothetical protein